MKAVFVTGTDTGVGKTIICGLLGRYLKERGYSVLPQKWIQTGSNSARDINTQLKLMRIKKNDVKEYLPFISPYILEFASSPHLAARLSKTIINAEQIKKSFKFLSDRFEFVIVEGTGGVLVPFTRKILAIDIAVELNLPVLIVAANKLGAVNHTLLTIEAVQKRNMPIVGIIFNNCRKKEKEIILRDNMRIIKTFSKENILGSLALMRNQELLYKSFLPIGKKIKQWISG